ncbi:fumarylacetoacetate hydrolase family protein [Actinomadura sp. DC4]|uniref:2-keto-4-pentenoate hydratase n=1 Tax=Actinomadura sp. DC4 TaxID=3055069 RepID=UPI0025B0EEB1|nr:fumarylacetoacetate hydrolase family protein [Actinomadura sp. DC4]MDN3354335.1 fumarylacetoacetate hydrolase family protein [Actinomadura sp. DC4]
MSTHEAIDRLAAARADRRPCAPVRDVLPPGDIDEAYAVQSAWVADRLAAGARIVGRKIGLTNPAVQAQLGVDQPDFGVLFDDMDCPEGKPVDVTRLLQPRIEGEIAFVLARDLTGAVIGQAEAAAAVGSVVAALEIVDSRVAGWDISIVDTVADNGSAGLFTLGESREPGDLDLPACAMTMRRGDEVVSTGTGSACLGDPLIALAWLAETARDHGRPLRAGDIVLSGSLGPVVPVAPGDRFHAEISGIGEVAVSFTGGGT